MRIYVVTDLASQMQYVGSTNQTLAQRFAGHCTSTATTLLSKAIHAKGKSNFRIELLEEIESKVDRTREGHWITVLNTLHPLGYNGANVSTTNVAKRNPGAKPVAATHKKRSYTLSLSPEEIVELERQAGVSGATVSRWVAAKLRLGKPKH